MSTYKTNNPTLKPIIDRGIDGLLTDHELETLKQLREFIDNESHPICDRAIACHRYDDILNGADTDIASILDNGEATEYVDTFITAILLAD